MLFENFSRDRSVTVTEFTRLIKLTIDNEPLLSDVWVLGEVSNVTRAISGHTYFTIKDQGASLRCVMFKNNALKNLNVTLREGISLQVHGNLGVYETAGQYQLIVDQLKEAGEGELYAEFARLKKKLEAEGVFDQERKRPIPESPKRIGVVTSETGAALQDILNTLSRRLPTVIVDLAPTLVQGADAPAGIIKALAALDQIPDLDVIILARGGGSIEDLWCFNNELVVRAVAGSKTPIITGVGHEIDFTLVDFAADLRAPTPTAAAEIATPITIEMLASQLAVFQQEMTQSLSMALSQRADLLFSIKSKLTYFTPSKMLMNQAQVVDGLSQRIQRAILGIQGIKHSQLAGLARRLDSIDPKGILKRGYAIVQERNTHKIISRVEPHLLGAELDVTMAKGKLVVVVQNVMVEK